MKSLSFLWCFCCILLTLSCEKKIIEIVPVLAIEKDMTIQGAGDIKFLAFPSPQIGFAAAEKDFIYKTTNGGDTWEQVVVAGGAICQGLEFFDTKKGMCLMNNQIYLTSDGGNTWKYSEDANFIGFTKDGRAVKGLCGLFSCEIFTSTNHGSWFSSIGSFNKEGLFIYGKVGDNELIVVTEESKYDGAVYAMDLSNGKPFSYYIDNLPYDAYLTAEKKVMAGVGGSIMHNSGHSFNREYYQHIYPYYSVDGYGDFVIVVGEKSVATNIDVGDGEDWHEVFDTNGDGFDDTFYKVIVVSQHEFYVAGSNGKIFKAKI